MTLEEAQAQIVQLQEDLTAITNERDTLLQNNETLTGELNSVRELNQKYFNKLTAHYFPEDDKTGKEDEEVVSCEEFAKKLKII